MNYIDIFSSIREYLPITSIIRFRALSKSYFEQCHYMNLRHLIIDSTQLNGLYALDLFKDHLNSSFLVAIVDKSWNTLVIRWNLYRYSDYIFIKKLIRGIIHEKIKELKLEIQTRSENISGVYVLPFNFFRVLNLESLSLSFVKMRIPHTPKVGQLTYLNLSFVRMETTNLGGFISDCPVLMVLRFVGVVGVKVLKVKSITIKKIEISRFSTDDLIKRVIKSISSEELNIYYRRDPHISEDSEIDIEAINLQCLRLEGNVPNDFKMTWSQKLFKSRILIEESTVEETPPELMASVRGITHFTTGAALLMRLLDKDLLPFFHKVTSLHLLVNDRTLKVVCLLHKFPSLKRLKITLNQLEDFYSFCKSSLESPELILQLQLVTVEFIVRHGINKDDLLNFFLKLGFRFSNRTSTTSYVFTSPKFPAFRLWFPRWILSLS